MTTPNQHWDAGLYDDKHAFVWRHGALVVELLDPKPDDASSTWAAAPAISRRASPNGRGRRRPGPLAEMLDQARTAYPRLGFEQDDARTFAFAEPFDAVFSNAVLHWVRPPEAVIRRVRAALTGRSLHRGTGRPRQRPPHRSGHADGGRTAEYPPIRVAVVFSRSGRVRFAAGGGGAGSAAARAVFDRPTPLEGQNGLRDWVQMFGGWAVDSVPMERREEFLTAAEEEARLDLYRDGGWFPTTAGCASRP